MFITSSKGGFTDMIRSGSNIAQMEENGHRQKDCENTSERQGGQKDLLCPEVASDTTDIGRRQKGCENISHYSEIARKGGYKGLLSMENDEVNEAATDDFGRRQKTCANISEYSAIALKGGHADLLKINDNHHHTPPEQKSKSHSSRTYGDWYTDEEEDQENKCLTSPEVLQTPTRDYRKGNGNCIVPGEEEETPSRGGKKMFGRKRQEAPFATYY